MKETQVKKVNVKKLALSRETLCALADEQVKAIVGGALPPTTDSVKACCA
jgi:hypothetical protein